MATLTKRPNAALLVIDVQNDVVAGAHKIVRHVLEDRHSCGESNHNPSRRPLRSAASEGSPGASTSGTPKPSDDGSPAHRGLNCRIAPRFAL